MAASSSGEFSAEPFEPWGYLFGYPLVLSRPHLSWYGSAMTTHVRPITVLDVEGKPCVAFRPVTPTRVILHRINLAIEFASYAVVLFILFFIAVGMGWITIA